MKKIVIPGILIPLSICAAWWLLAHRTAPSKPVPATGAAERADSNAAMRTIQMRKKTNASSHGAARQRFISKAERSQMFDGTRLRYLEQLGHVPEDADAQDWQLAEKTSWWGKPLDPKEFWKGRVIWLDDAARSAANRHGRRYPPIPYEDPTLPAYPNDDGIDWDSASVDSGPTPHFASSSKERAFWDRFTKTRPKPPASLERKQFDVATDILETRDQEKKGDLPPGISSGSAARFEPIQKERALELGYPPEAFTEEAMFWAYVLARRRDYQEMVAAGVPSNQTVVVSFFKRLAVDSKYVTEPLSEEQLKAASAWKIAYLRRLRSEKVDESYINAYLEAWNLLPRDVFPDGK